MSDGLFSKIFQSLCRCFSGGMNKSFVSPADKKLAEFRQSHPELSASEQAEIKKHTHIFERKSPSIEID